MNYSEIIKDVLSVITEAGNDQGISIEGVYDEAAKKYIVTEKGTVHDESFYNVVVAMKVENEKIIIEHNLTDIDFREKFVESGIKYENIVYA